MKTVYTETDDITGTVTKVHEDEGKTVIEKVWDAEPLLQHAADARQATAGMSWGEGRKIGTVPMEILGMFMRQDGGLDKKRLTEWLRQNPAFICFDKFK